MRHLQTRPQMWTLTYFLLYLPWFTALEERDPLQCTIVQLRLDRMIPFCEYFIIPYLLWFLYIGAGLAYLMFTLPRQDYYRLAGLLFGGLTVCLILYSFFYTGLYLRPTINPDKNVFTWLVARLWAVDTSTNVCPSIHVFATLVMHHALSERGVVREHRVLRWGNTLLAASIVLATMFLKQHSVIDVCCAFVLYRVLYAVVYSALPAPAHQRRRYQRLGA